MTKSRLFDFSGPAMAIVALVLMCGVSVRYVPFWYDELLTHILVSDPSFTHMLGAQADLINSAPPLYFILTWPVAQVFGSSEFVLRIWSSLGIFAAMVLTWCLLQRLYGAWPASSAVVVGFFSSAMVLYQNMEARCYGLFLAEIALATLLGVLLVSRRPASKKLLAANAVTHAALVTTHYFGFFYSGVIIIALGLRLYGQPRQLVRGVASVLIGWLAFIPCVPILICHMEFNHPHGWIDVPDFKDLRKLIHEDVGSAWPAALVVLGMTATIGWYGRRRRGNSGLTSAGGVDSPSIAPDADCRAERRTLAAIMFGYLLIPPSVWILSQFAPPVFLPRYFIGDALISCFVFAQLTFWMLEAVRRLQRDLPEKVSGALYWLPQFCLALLAIGYIGYPTTRLIQQMSLGQYQKIKGVPYQPVAIADVQLPIVFENSGEFLPRYHYRSPSQNLICVIDRDAAIDPKASRRANNLDQIATALKRHYPELPIYTTAELLARYDRFIVLKVEWLVWFERNIDGRENLWWRNVMSQCDDLRSRGVSPILVSRIDRAAPPRSSTRLASPVSGRSATD